MTSHGKSEDDSVTSEWMKNLKSKLTESGKWKEFLDQLQSCKTNIERLQTVAQLDIIESIVDVESVPFLKNEEEAVSYREAGNALFQKKDYVKALKQYSRSIMLSPAAGDTATLALACANRSAVLFHLKMYEECLADITAAQQYGYPEKLMYKLHDRSGKCHQQLGDLERAEQAFEAGKHALHKSQLDKNKINSMINECEKHISKCQKQVSGVVSSKGVKLRSALPKPSGQGRDGVLAISNNVTMGLSKESGRGLYANRDIDVGEVLIVEKPYSSTVLSTLKNTYCHHCCSRVVSPVPCLSCSGVLFCSDQCHTEACELYHKYECPVLHKVWKADISLGHLALKMVLKAGIGTLGKYSEVEMDEKQLEAFSLGEEYDPESYKSVYILVNHAADRHVEHLLKYCLQALFLVKCLEQSGFLGEEKGIAEQLRMNVGAHLMRNLMMMPCNAHECSELLYKEGNLPESVTVEVGSAIYPCLSLINHSCDPNVVRHSYKNLCVVRAIRNIPKGSELLDNYGALCALTPTEERRKKLESQYFFTCHCQACTDDYPQYLDLPTDTPVFKCDKCEGPVFLPLKGGYSDVPCSFCQHKHEITPRIGSLGQSDELYRMAMMDVLTGECKNLDENITTLEGHLQLMDKVICRPWRDYNDCQEALKQCYACKANNFPAKLA